MYRERKPSLLETDGGSHDQLCWVSPAGNTLRRVRWVIQAHGAQHTIGMLYQENDKEGRVVLKCGCTTLPGRWRQLYTIARTMAETMAVTIDDTQHLIVVVGGVALPFQKIRARYGNVGWLGVCVCSEPSPTHSDAYMRVVPLPDERGWARTFLVTLRMRGEVVMTFTLVVEKERRRCYMDVDGEIMPAGWAITVNARTYNPYDSLDMLRLIVGVPDCSVPV